MSNKLLLRVIGFFAGLILVLSGLSIYQSIQITRLSQEDKQVVSTPESVINRTSFSPKLYFVDGLYPPMYLGVSDGSKQIYGTAYVAENRIWTVEHVVRNRPDPESITMFLGEKYGNDWVDLGEMTCSTWPINDERFGTDGTCVSRELDQYDNFRLMGVGTQIVRRNAADYEFTQVAVWNILNSYWMFFEVVDKADTEYTAEGNTIDLIGNGIADGISQICDGFSGSPVFLANDGQLVLENNRYVSIGEVRSIMRDVRMYQERLHCGSRFWFSVVYPDF